MNVPFGKLYEDVVTLTNRPEMVGETKLAIRNATQYFHMIDFWQRDCIEELKQFSVPNFAFQLDIPTEFARYRKIRYIKKYDLTSLVPKEGEFHKISEASPDSLFDRYNSIRSNVFYLAGTNLNIRLNTQESGLLISWYTYPEVEPESYQSWIADMLSSVIVNRAVAEIQNSIGMVEEANRRMKHSEDIDVPLVRTQDVEAFARG